MKINRLFGAFGTVALFFASNVAAQNFQTMPVQSGYTADVIANGIGSSMTSTSTDVDGVSFAFVARDFQLTSTSSPLTYGIPTNGTINSVASATPGLSFQLGNLSGNNSLRLVTTGETGTLVFGTPKAAFKLYLLSTSGSGTSTVSATITFTDNTTQVLSSISLSDWYGGSNFAIQGIGRINRTNDVLEPNSTNPRLYQSVLNIDAANVTKPIQSITIAKSGGTGISNIFAISADAFTDCSAPTLSPVGTLSSNSAQVSWTIPPTTTAASYDVYYSTSNTPPTSTTTPNMTGITGTSTTIGSLSSSTTYYYWVRTNCTTATSQSGWSVGGSFTTLCGAMIPAYTNTFSPFPGNCWVNNLSGGTPATGPSGTSTYWTEDGFLNVTTTGSARINLYSSNRAGWLKTVPFDLSAGGYRVKFDYGATTYSGTAASPMGSDDVIYFMVSNDGGSTWDILKTWDVNNAASNVSTTYSYDLANNTGANTVFAFYGNDGPVDDAPDYNFYVDNFTVEAAQLSTSEVNGNKKAVTVHPNPFKDVLYISDTREVKSVNVTDVSGRLLKTIENPTKEINLSTLNAGLYFVNIQFKDGSKTTVKAIKQ
ncbi:T9SS type A sorting domain-containing protein [Chryseobacterium paridis]|uniref:T9SS type A sorting domain-containing protein n=1 Tax=Chryseobacterium paridis TaxID=2800328 RepID=A0ABS1FZJ2_9FLAO|nr:T9SS type A sorting domain-containing protein [Chryseobacterium paridis]MBK1897864.1 T9SS type A sorting domain-containing protein [Chryseobacterium paridis]